MHFYFRHCRKLLGSQFLFVCENGHFFHPPPRIGSGSAIIYNEITFSCVSTSNTVVNNWAVNFFFVKMGTPLRIEIYEYSSHNILLHVLVSHRKFSLLVTLVENIFLRFYYVDDVEGHAILIYIMIMPYILGI